MSALAGSGFDRSDVELLHRQEGLRDAVDLLLRAFRPLPERYEVGINLYL